MKKMDFENFYQHDIDVYSLEGFQPVGVNKEYLDNLGVTVDASEETYAKLKAGSKIFIDRYNNKTVIPVQKLVLEDIVPEEVE
ncbi:MAG: hypothetical protein II915_05975, partial [Eubacterium sp.]|nr:hypothetical protein [Eubacterium sp.]